MKRSPVKYGDGDDRGGNDEGSARSVMEEG